MTLIALKTKIILVVDIMIKRVTLRDVAFIHYY